MDLLDDIFSEPSCAKAPVCAKFQPKAKPRPKKATSSTGPNHAAISTNEQTIPSAVANSDASQLVQPNDSVNKNLDIPNSSSTEIDVPEEAVLRRDDSNLEKILVDGNLSAEVKDVVDSAITGHSEIAISNTCEDGHLSAGTSFGSQGLKDVIGQSTTADMRMLDASTTQAEGDTSGFANVTFTSTSPFRPCNAYGIPIPLTNQESGYSKETLIGSVGDFQIDMEQETVDFSFLESVDITSDAPAPSGNRAVKFQPKPKAQSSRKTDSAEVVSHLSGDFIMDPTIVQLDTIVSDNVDSMVAPNFPKETGNDEMRKTSVAVSVSHDSSDGGAVLLGVEATEKGYGSVDGVNDGIQFNGSSSPAKAINEPAANSDENTDDCHIAEERSKKKRTRNSKKISSENGKPSGKRRNEAKEPEESTKKPRKKFPHATRRKRSVDKSLLEAPEDEIDLHRVPIRDLIILADYKERQAKNQAVVPPSTNERSENTLQEEPHDEDEAYGSDQGTGSFDNPSTSRVIKDTGYFNYQSYVDRKQKRWLKHETELLYQGIQEYGSDFSMIQQRYFPDRSRHQVKLKYKKEERIHPMRIHDALTTRAKDLSHFEILIQKLREEEQAAQEKAEQADDDNLIGSMGEEDEGGDGDTHETHTTSQEAAKSEQNGGSAACNKEPDDTARVESAAKSCESEDEFDWNEYKSEL